MLAIGRALMTNPDIILLDEATEGLAPKIRDEIWETVPEIRAAGIAAVVIDKNLDDLLRSPTATWCSPRARSCSTARPPN